MCYFSGNNYQPSNAGKRDCPWFHNQGFLASELHTNMSDRDWPSLQIHHDMTVPHQSNGPKPTAKVKPTVGRFLYIMQTIESQLSIGIK